MTDQPAPPPLPPVIKKRTWFKKTRIVSLAPAVRRGTAAVARHPCSWKRGLDRERRHGYITAHKPPDLENSRAILENSRKYYCKINCFGGEWCNGSTIEFRVKPLKMLAGFRNTSTKLIRLFPNTSEPVCETCVLLGKVRFHRPARQSRAGLVACSAPQRIAPRFIAPRKAALITTGPARPKPTFSEFVRQKPIYQQTVICGVICASNRASKPTRACLLAAITTIFIRPSNWSHCRR